MIPNSRGSDFQFVTCCVHPLCPQQKWWYKSLKVMSNFQSSCLSLQGPSYEQTLFPTFLTTEGSRWLGSEPTKNREETFSIERKTGNRKIEWNFLKRKREGARKSPDKRHDGRQPQMRAGMKGTQCGIASWLFLSFKQSSLTEHAMPRTTTLPRVRTMGWCPKFIWANKLKTGVCSLWAQEEQFQRLKTSTLASSKV